MVTARYTVTEMAGPKVAGRRVQVGDVLDLTENAARAELLVGAIVPAAEGVVATEATETEPQKKRR